MGRSELHPLHQGTHRRYNGNDKVWAGEMPDGCVFVKKDDLLFRKISTTTC